MIPCRDISSTGAHCSSQMRCRKQCWKHSVMRCQGKRSSRERVERAPLGGVSENEVYTYIYVLYYYVWYLLRIVISWCYFSNFKRESADLPVDLGLIFRQTQLVRHVFFAKCPSFTVCALLWLLLNHGWNNQFGRGVQTLLGIVVTACISVSWIGWLQYIGYMTSSYKDWTYLNTVVQVFAVRRFVHLLFGQRKLDCASQDLVPWCNKL